MNNKCLIIIIIILSFITILSSPKKETTFFDDKNISINVKDTKTNIIENIDLEEYVIGVVAGEMPASFNEEALKAQAVAARTYAVFQINENKKDYDLKNDNSSQVFITIYEMKKKWDKDFDKYYNKIKKVVEKTKNEVITYNEKVISSYYFAISNGYTESSSLVFKENKEYLNSVESSWDKNIKNFLKTVTINKKDFCNKLKIDCNEIKISDIVKTASGRVDKLKVNNKDFSGTQFRKLLNLRSTDFKIEIGDDIKITTKGYGHGVGMSQYGANEMAKQGFSYDQILAYYYKNTKISKL